MIVQATEDGYRKIKGADHEHPFWHYKLTPGGAYYMAPDGTWQSEVEITPAMAAESETTHNIHFVGGRSVVAFRVGDRLVAQPLPSIKDAAAKMDRQSPRRIAAAKPPQPRVLTEPQEAPRRKRRKMDFL